MMLMCDYCGKWMPGSGYGGYRGTALPQCKECADRALGINPDGKDQRIAALEAEIAELKRENIALKALRNPHPRKPYGKGHVWTGEDTGMRIEWDTVQKDGKA